MDISASAVSTAQTKLGLAAQIYQGAPLDAPEMPMSDVITLWDVLDHLTNPEEALRVLYANILSGGMLVVRVRNGPFHAHMRKFETLARHIMRIPPSQNHLTVIHRFGFSLHALRALLERTGFHEINHELFALTSSRKDRTTGAGQWLQKLKEALQIASRAIYRLSRGRIYLSPSILLRAYRP
jgi:2-polyprenyl-3-methyl-5-hydroxy-6-metoxy-1,4-benzoquinol methylase